MTETRMRFFGTLHPAVSMCYFVCVIGLTLACPHMVTVLLSLVGGAMFNLALRGGKAFGRTMRFVLPMFLIVCIGNPMVNHRGVTMLFLLFNQWITLEAIVYGIVTACSLAAIILWFGCYQEVMTSDKFLYLFGKIAPATALLITSALRFIPQMQQNAAQIKESRAMLQDNSPRLFQKLAHAIQNLSALLGMSMENAVQTADSMKARGFGARRRTTFHLFRFDARDARTLALMLTLCGICVVARCYGHGYMEYYPRITALTMGPSSMTMFILFAALMLLPSILEAKEAVVWRSYGLIR